jgi:hypothetical protein
MSTTVRPIDVRPEDVRPGEVPDDISEKEASSGTLTPNSKSPLASRQTAYNVVTGPVTSVYDTAQAEFYQPRADWEVILSFAVIGGLMLTV